MIGLVVVVILIFSNATATTEIYTDVHTLSLHDAIPISLHGFATGYVLPVSAEEEGARYRLDAMCSRESGNPEPQAPSSATLDSRFRGSTGDGTSEQSVASSTLRRAMYAPLIDLDAPPPPVTSPTRKSVV